MHVLKATQNWTMPKKNKKCPSIFLVLYRQVRIIIRKKQVMSMYVVKVLHGYIDKTGCRTREKNPDNLLVFKDKKKSETFAKQIGGRVKLLQEMRPD